MTPKQRGRVDALLKQARDAFLLLSVEAPELNLDHNSRLALQIHSNAFGPVADTLTSQPVAS